ncbi:MAG TPA: DUF4097 family beta strand repeat-containing protein, partial [Vicinamibacterales bacterium]|nr:DUF4097 family beta strand repeat-containing protein [Vicinamibacterales bacterium]
NQMNRFPTIAAAAIALTVSAAAGAQPRDLSDGAQPRAESSSAQQPIQARPGGPESGPGSEKTVDVTKGTRLVLSNQAGEVVVRSWDQDRVRIQASHGSRETISAETTDNTLRIRTTRTGSSRGPGGLVDYQITVPRWMPVNLTGTYLDATIEGTQAEVTVETVHGNARVTGGNGAVSLRSVEGVITVDKASGRVQATTVNEGIRITNSSGEISAETTNGDVFIDNAQTSNLEVFTVNGEVTFNGTIRDSGVYKLGTHNGDIRVGLGGANNATIFVRTFQGDFAADFPVQLPDGQNARSGSKRFNFTMGSGSARVELQSFGGDIVLARKTIVSRAEERQRRRMNTPMAPPAPPAPPGVAPVPSPAPTPKPPKPPGFDGIWDTAFDLVHEFDHHFDSEQFAKEWEHKIEQEFGKDFEKKFEKQFNKEFEKTIGSFFKKQ